MVPFLCVPCVVRSCSTGLLSFVCLKTKEQPLVLIM
jgi:hypothetical protein